MNFGIYIYKKEVKAYCFFNFHIGLFIYSYLLLLEIIMWQKVVQQPWH